ncbi:hypothetical protein AX761_05795 [Rhizobium sp. 58]|nr:hypothetical protein AX761_05795 [Rhizobium sp. 58]
MLQAERPCDQTIRSLQARIISSAIFARSERLRTFFSYVVTEEVAGAGHQLKGYTIGIDVFGRPHAFNADSDPLVRVHAGKLRKLLDAYYAAEGADDEWKIVIPKGTYIPEYHRLKATPISTPETVPAAAPQKQAIQAAHPSKKRNGKSAAWLPAPLSSPLALLSVLPLLLLAPLASHGITGNIEANAKLIAILPAAEGVSYDLPSLAVNATWPAADKVKDFADAVRAASANYSTITTTRNSAKRMPEKRAFSPLSFTMEISRQETPAGLVVVLLNDSTGEKLSTDVIADARVAHKADVLFESLSLVARILSVRGDIFRFAEARNIQSTLMDCMVSTDSYRRIQTKETFRVANDCQERLSASHRKSLNFVISASALPGTLDR